MLLPIVHDSDRYAAAGMDRLSALLSVFALRAHLFHAGPLLVIDAVRGRARRFAPRDDSRSPTARSIARCVAPEPAPRCCCTRARWSIDFQRAPQKTSSVPRLTLIYGRYPVQQALPAFLYSADC